MKKLMMKTLAALGMTMGLTITPVFAGEMHINPAAEPEPVEYLEPVYKTVGGITSPTNGIDHWETKSISDYNVVQDITTMMSAGWWVVDGTISCGNIRMSGAVHLILKDGCSLTVESSDDAGISVMTDDGASLAIYGQSAGTGKLSANGGEGCAGIGGGNNVASGPITINGGEVTATGGDGGSSRSNGAGIGGGVYGSGSDITINGGTVKATGGTEGAGIGGGGKENGSSITINGGTVTAEGGQGGAGIGGGAYGGGSDITINGGTVNATGSASDCNGSSAGIGGGVSGSGSNITISGGTVKASTAIGGWGNFTAIGSGNGGDQASNIKVNPLMTLKADSNDPPTTVIPNTGADLANDLKNKRYATAAIGYTLYLKDGEAYRGSVEEANKITSLMAAAGLTCADNVWTMNNFVFKTSESPAFRVQSDTTIVLVGTNSVVAGVNEGNSTGLMLESAVTIMGDGVLNAEAVDAECEAAFVVDNKAFVLSGKACIFAKSAGEGSSNKVAVDARTGELSATVTDATTGEVLTYDESPHTYKDAQGNIATYAKLTTMPTKVTVTDVDNATWVAYTNDVPLTGEQPYTVEGNSIVKVVYKAANNYMFPGGYKTLTTNVTASAATLTVTLTAEQQPRLAVANPNCLTFSAAEDFGIMMKKKNSPPTVNLEYSTNQIYWETFNKEQGAKAADTGAGYKLYLRGSSNKAFASSEMQRYTFANTADSAATAIACSGNIETLLDYQTVAAGEHPEMANYAFSYLFDTFSALTAAPELPAKTLSKHCYNSMFQKTALTAAPELPATNLAEQCYYCMFWKCTSLVVNTNAPGKAWLIPAEAKTATNWNQMMFKDTSGNITSTTVTPGEIYYVRSALVPVTVELPEVAGATAQLYTFYTKGGWMATATNEVPSNATVRVVWTADAGKTLSGEGATGVYVWQTEFGPVIGGEVAPAPTVGEADVTEVTIGLDTRAKKSYFEKEGILPVWYAAGAGSEVKVKGEGEQSWETIVKSPATTNTVSWLPDSIGVYDLTQTGELTGQIIYTTPVDLTTNGLEVANTTVAVTADGAAIPEDGRIATNSTVTVTWTVDASAAGKYFMDGTTTYTASFTATGAASFDAATILAAGGLIPEEPKEPSVKIGVVGQRYPWNGVLSVQYWAKNTPNTGYQITVTVTLPDGTAGAKTLQASEAHDCKNGKNETEFNAREHFGEVTIPKGVKVRATLAPLPDA